MSHHSNNKLFSITLSEGLDIESVKNLNLKDLPAYAKYIREQKFNEFVTIHNNLARTTRLALALLEENLAKMLTALSSHSITEYIATSINAWINGKIQELSRHQIVPEDITTITFIRRKAFRDLLPNYTADTCLSFNILDEVDLFLTEYERVLFRTLSVLNASIIREQSEEIDMLRSYTNQLEEKNRQLAAKNKELESFTHIASHDLQEPLRKIKLWANRLQDIEKLPDNAKSAIGKITASTGKMQALIGGVLNYVQADDRQKEFVTVDLNGLVKEILDDYSEALEQKKAVVHMGILPTLPVIELQIKQLFANLVSNAVKYSKPDRPLKISITSKEQPPTTAGSTPFFQIVVSDNGIGFPQEQAENIFEIFRRLGGSDAAGTGIGLAICRKIVQNHNGTIRAESKEDAGTSFFISLPASPEGATSGR